MKEYNCDKIKLLLPLYIDHMLSQEEMDSVRAHLAACSSCEEEYRFLKGIMQTAAALPEIEVTDAFRASLHEKLLKSGKLSVSKGKNKWLRDWRTYGAVAASAAIIALSVVSVTHLPGGEERSINSDPAPIEAPLDGAEKTAGPASTAQAASETPASTSAPTAGAQTDEQTNGSIQSNTSAKTEQERTGNGPEGGLVQSQPQASEQEREAVYNEPQAAFAEDANQQYSAPLQPEPSQSLPETQTESVQEESAERAEVAAAGAAVPEMLQDSPSSGGTGGGSGAQAVPPANNGSASRDTSGSFSTAADQGSPTDAGGVLMSVSAKIATTTRMQFDQAGYSQAQAVLAEYTQENGAYVVEESSASEVFQELTSLDGYIASLEDVTDYTQEYTSLEDELTQNQEAAANDGTENYAERNEEIQNRLDEIDAEVSNCRIILEKVQ